MTKNNSIYFFVFLLVFSAACSSPAAPAPLSFFPIHPAPTYNPPPTPNMPYQQTKASIAQQRIQAQHLPLDSISQRFTQILLQQIIPYWYGTPWSFEGHTSTPQEGSIACGYFVSTSLRDAGLQLNRYRLAQQNPLNEAKSIAGPTPLLHIRANTASAIQQLQDKLSSGIHFIGFGQSHVGYLLKIDQKLYLIHSNYLQAEGVVLEKITDSSVFAAFQEFHIAPISGNSYLLNKWIQEEELEVIQ